MNCEILTVGTEILLGDILNTNTRYLARELADLGIGIFRQSSVGDNRQRLLEAFESAFDHSDIVLTTGGLGPTADDITKEVAAQFLGLELVPHEPSLKMLEKYFGKGSLGYEKNLKQALFPEQALVLENPNGTAPGCIMENQKGQIIIVLPGPPREMEPMFQHKVRPYLEEKSGFTIQSKVLRFTGIGEWDMGDRVRDLLDLANPTVAPYAKDGECILRISARAKTSQEAHEIIAPVATEIKQRLGQYLYGEGEETLREKVPRLLLEKNLTVATAESLTGGLLASAFIDSDLGISASFLEGFVTYSNEAKISRLGVKEETLTTYGAVSEEVAREMAEGLARQTGADFALATTGIAGPTGGSTEKPVGLTYIAITHQGETRVYREIFKGSRNKLRARVVRTVLARLGERLITEDADSQ